MPSRDINSNTQQYRTSKSWIDDLPLCPKSGIGLALNHIYRNDFTTLEEHLFEDRSFYCQLDSYTYLYGVFDGHRGTRAAEFALQRMAAEILFGQLTEKRTDEEIKEVLRQAYISVEKGYLDSVDDLLAERTSLQCDIPEGLPVHEVCEKYPHILDKLEKISKINHELSSGTSAAIALIYYNKLYVANVGNSRALLCKTDLNGVLRVVQLSVDHDLKNEDEILRLMQLGIPTENLKYGRQLGNQETTRCLGNYMVKGGYREFEELRRAVSEPVIAEPDIHGGIILDESCQFLLLMSAGLYQAIEQLMPTTEVNKYIAQSVVEQFRTQSTLNNVAEAIVRKVEQLHHSKLIEVQGRNVTGKREDITLIVRNFNFPLPNAQSFVTNSSADTTHSAIYNSLSSTNSSNSSAYHHETNNATTNSNRRLKPYVDFSIYYKNIKKVREK